MICEILCPFLVNVRSYILAHGQHEAHTCCIIFPEKFSEYFISGEWFSQAVGDDMVEIEDAGYFYMFSKTMVQVGKFVGKSKGI